VELEARKSLAFLAGALEPLTVFSNVTLIQSEIELGGDPRVAPEKRALIGQAPYVVNLGLTYAAPVRDLTATVLYNRIGRRVFEASQPPLPTTYEQPRDVLDLSLRFPVLGGLAAKLDARNLLDTPHELLQGPVVRETYRVGRTFQLGLTWQR
jgi:hypothetical protein